MAYNFKSEEDVKEYLKNLGIEYRFGCFKESKPAVCHLLGDYLESIDSNYEKARKIYQENCDERHYGKSCLKSGNYFAMGRGLSKEDHVKALEYFEKSCNLDEYTGCYRAGVLSTMFSAISATPTRTYKQGLELMDKACNGKDNVACHHLSSIYSVGNEKEKVAKDMKRSFEYALKACDLDNLYGCGIVSLMYKTGEGVEMDLDLAKKFRAKAEEIRDEMLKQRELTFQQGLSNV